MWGQEHQSESKPLIPLRMVRACARFVFFQTADDELVAQIPWGDEFEHETARRLFGSNRLALTWIKGEPRPRDLVDEILRALGLKRETETQVQTRRERSASLRQRGSSSFGKNPA